MSGLQLAPIVYRCTGCGVEGRKLWREYQTTANATLLLCVRCTEAHEDRRLDVGQPGSDQIGWFVPAVPTEDGMTFHSYAAVPVARAAWWKALPL